MKRIAIVGGGLAGLSAAVQLAAKNNHITLFEAAPYLGGRAHGFYNISTDTYLDNGQHILMGCYDYTNRFLKQIQAAKTYTYQKRLSVCYLDEQRQFHQLSAETAFYPFNLLLAILRFTAIPFTDRFRCATLATRLLFMNPAKYSNYSVTDWYAAMKQPTIAIEALWDSIGVGALNTSPEKASTEMLIKILKQMFFSGNFSSTIILPPVPITEGFVPQTMAYLKKHNSEILTSEKVTEVIAENDLIRKIKTNKSVYTDFDYVIFAIPPYALQRIKNIEVLIPAGVPEFTYSSILTGQFFLKDNPLKEPFYSLIGSPAQWIFNHGSYLTTVTSDAERYIAMSKEDIAWILLSEIEKYTQIRKETISTYRIIKEKRATIESTNSNKRNRPAARTNCKNTFLAGDWTNTGLPATIEGAVKSGYTASDLILSRINAFSTADSE